VIMLLNTGPDRPASLGSPFFQASAAAAMDLEVEVYFSASNIALLRPGVAEELFPGKEKTKSVYQFMQEAHAAGARFFACGSGMEEHDLTIDETIPEFDGACGAASFIDTIIQDNVVTLSY
ncbi:MAG: DsrE family protein, partial [Gammaproteobacteria bacterium]|nr:DsrE family protein [Gammaproteobacteria bacterium]